MYFLYEMFKILTVSGAPPQTSRRSLRRSPDPIAARGFLPSTIAASRLRLLQFPPGLKYNSVKERWPMRRGEFAPEVLGGIDAPVGDQCMGRPPTSNFGRTVPPVALGLRPCYVAYAESNFFYGIYPTINSRWLYHCSKLQTDVYIIYSRTLSLSNNQ